MDPAAALSVWIREHLTLEPGVPLMWTMDGPSEGGARPPVGLGGREPVICQTADSLLFSLVGKTKSYLCRKNDGEIHFFGGGFVLVTDLFVWDVGAFRPSLAETHPFNCNGAPSGHKLKLT